jgi:hypothetical protein
MKIYITKGQLEDKYLDINYFIRKASDFLGTEESLRNFTCIEVALNYAEQLKTEINELRSGINALTKKCEELQQIIDAEPREEDRYSL